MTYSDLKPKLDGFLGYLLNRLSPNTARVYRSAVSSALKRHSKGLDDVDGLVDYADTLVKTNPARANVFLSAWSHFIVYMADEHGIEVPELRADTRAALSVESAPVEAIYELRSAVPDTIPLKNFARMRWDDVQRDGDRLRLLMENDRGHVVRWTVSERGLEALKLLQRWGWRAIPVSKESPILPEAPDSFRFMSRQRLGLLLAREAERRRVTASTHANDEFVVLNEVPEDVAPMSSVATAQQDATRTLSAAEEVAQLDPRSSGGFARSDKFELDVNVAQQLYNMWCAETPDLEADRVPAYGRADGMSENAGEKATMIWRRCRWELGKANDFGLPPQSLLKRSVSPNVNSGILGFASGAPVKPAWEVFPGVAKPGEESPNVNSPPDAIPGVVVTEGGVVFEPAELD